MTTIKICGVRDTDTMRACVEAGVEYVGLNFAPGSRRAVDVEEARTLVAVAGVTPPQLVGVFQDCPAKLVVQIAERVGLHLAQLHGRESVNDCMEVAKHLPVIKALPFDAVSMNADRYRAAGARILVDGRRAGSGEAWAYAPFVGAEDAFLAGGLHASNVAEAIACVSPYGVDTASGVEVAGVAEPDLVFAFVRAVRSVRAHSPRD